MDISSLIKRKDLLRNQAYIAGKWMDVDSKKTFEVINPASGEVIAVLPNQGVAETKLAIDSAHDAFGSWKDKTATERSRILRKWFELQLKHVDDLATILTLEQGKPLAEAKGEIKYGASFVEWFAEEAKRVYGDVIPSTMKSARIVTLKQPIGVAAAITPWNFPNAMITRKVAPALAAGCTVVIKPSEETPLSALALAVLAEEAGVPAGVFNVLTTSDSKVVGLELSTNPKVKKLSFTGSTAVGKLLMQQCASTVKKLSLELGGNAPFIVLEDADLEAAAQGAIDAKYRNAGQTCISVNRLFVHENVKDAFVKILNDKVNHLKVGSGLDAGVDIGPLINQKAKEKVIRLIDDATSHGAKIVAGGASSETNNKSTYFNPTVITDVNPSMKIFNEEVFGPVTTVITFKTESEVIAMANDTNYGLASYFYGNNLSQVWRVAEALEFGMVGINTTHISSAVAPFGGVKESGFGREGSKYGMDEYLIIKYLCIAI